MINTNHQPIAILGGMGPDASARLYQLLIELSRSEFGAVENHQYPEIVIDSVPVPEFFSNTQKALADLEQETSVPFVSIPNETIKEVKKRGYARIGLLGSPITIFSDIYQTKFLDKNIEVVLPDNGYIEELGEIIRNTGKSVINQILYRRVNMIDEKIKKYSEQLNKLGIEHKILEHPELKTVEEVQSYLGYTVADSCPALVMKADNDFMVVIKRGDCKLDSKKLKKFLGVENLRLATKEEFEKLTNLQIGTARVFNSKMRTLLDKKIFEKEYLNGGTGSFTCTFRYKTEDLKKISNCEVIDVTETEGAQNFGKKRVFSGTRATGRLHLGNYLGAVKGYIELQNKPDYECIYMAVDVHTITTPYDFKTLSKATRNILLDYLACGLDPKKSIITAQSLVPEHTDLAFLFSSMISVARMQHLPTFKEKIQQNPDNVTMALLNYPVLMAADILIYKAGLVPVGIDQEPHLEIAREIARKMNETFGMDFPEPKRFATKGEYVPSLLGEGKMSKSVEGSYINLTDDLEMIKKKLAQTPTDSGKGKSVPTSGGVANLLTFVELFQGQKKRVEYEKKYMTDGLRYHELKNSLAEVIYKELEPIRLKRKELETKPEYVMQVIKDGAERARKLAQKTIDEVKEKMGLKGGI
ncbi:MAG: tryptophan--tRNA ligase [Patescibacteria group bacterium]|nr:tryptophan--tRNA ligase [Patescibacteria group bacterium]